MEELEATILLIDDEVAICRAFSRSMRGLGFEIVTATSARDAMKLCEEQTFAVIVVDFNLPEGNGIQIIDALRRLQPHATYVLVSGSCSLDLALEAVNKHGIHHVMPKPWSTRDLQHLIGRGVQAFWARQARVPAPLVASGPRRVAEQRIVFQDLVRSHVRSLADMLLSALNLRDHETKAHCYRVASYTKLLLDALGVDDGPNGTIELGALLHDVGKIGVPDSILLKPGKLTPEEWEIMRTHPRLGAHLLKGFDSLEGATRVVVEHHERWDGSGYPAGLRGKAICLGARVFAVADTVDAILSDRPYRKGAPFSVARREVEGGRGTQFDPDVVAAFLEVPEDAWLDVRRRHPDDEIGEDTSATAPETPALPATPLVA